MLKRPLFTLTFRIITPLKQKIAPPGSHYCVSQVGAHGTGATIPPMDEQITSMKIVTPALGTIELSEVSIAHRNPL